MISDGDLKRIQSRVALRNAEIVKVESAIDTAIIWLKMYARNGEVDEVDRMQEDLEQALTELWQLASIKK
jgi:hypothetical protein